MDTKNPARRRMRISAVFSEWARTPLLLAVPLLILVLSFVADGAQEAGLHTVASSFAGMAYSCIFVLVGLLSVAFLRL